MPGQVESERILTTSESCQAPKLRTFELRKTKEWIGKSGDDCSTLRVRLRPTTPGRQYEYRWLNNLKFWVVDSCYETQTAKLAFEESGNTQRRQLSIDQVEKRNQIINIDGGKIKVGKVAPDGKVRFIMVFPQDLDLYSTTPEVAKLSTQPTKAGQLT